MTSFGAQIKVGENETTEFKYAFDEEAGNICTPKVASIKRLCIFEWVGKWEVMSV